MRVLLKNAQPLFIATYKDKEKIIDDYGNETGEHKITYNPPVKVKWNVSFVDSDAEVAMFGIDSRNVIRVVSDRMVDETSIIWFGKKPSSPFVDYAPNHNYRIIGVRPSLNHVIFYAQKINTFLEQGNEP